MLSRLIEYFVDPDAGSIDMDSSTRLHIHRKIYLRKPLLKKVFSYFHHEFNRLDRLFFEGEGYRVELGLGSHQCEIHSLMS